MPMLPGLIGQEAQNCLNPQGRGGGCDGKDHRAGLSVSNQQGWKTSSEPTHVVGIDASGCRDAAIEASDDCTGT